MTTSEWIGIISGVLGTLVTWGGIIIAGTKWIEGVRTEAAKKDAATWQETERLIDATQEKFAASQRTQDQHFGEGVAAVRQHIVNVEQKLYQVEIYGRDNYAVKDDMREVRQDIKDMRNEIKADLQLISEKIEKRG